jgi:amidohydrolase
MKVIPEIEEADGMIRGFRHHLHSYPELGYDVHETVRLVAEKLEQWGIAVTRGVGKTGLVGALSRGRRGRSLGLRADMDALPIHEANTFAHRSQRPGVMHACGHDGHVSMLLGAAHYLAKHGKFDGTIHFIFQPAEEGLAGARAMVDDGLFRALPL